MEEETEDLTSAYQFKKARDVYMSLISMQEDEVKIRSERKWDCKGKVETLAKLSKDALSSLNTSETKVECDKIFATKEIGDSGEIFESRNEEIVDIGDTFETEEITENKIFSNEDIAECGGRVAKEEHADSDQNVKRVEHGKDEIIAKEEPAESYETVKQEEQAESDESVKREEQDEIDEITENEKHSENVEAIRGEEHLVRGLKEEEISYSKETIAKNENNDKSEIGEFFLTEGISANGEILILTNEEPKSIDTLTKDEIVECIETNEKVHTERNKTIVIEEVTASDEVITRSEIAESDVKFATEEYSEIGKTTEKEEIAEIDEIIEKQRLIIIELGKEAVPDCKEVIEKLTNKEIAESVEIFSTEEAGESSEIFVTEEIEESGERFVTERIEKSGERFVTEEIAESSEKATKEIADSGENVKITESGEYMEIAENGENVEIAESGDNVEIVKIMEKDGSTENAKTVEKVQQAESKFEIEEFFGGKEVKVEMTKIEEIMEKIEKSEKMESYQTLGREAEDDCEVTGIVAKMASSLISVDCTQPSQDLDLKLQNETVMDDLQAGIISEDGSEKEGCSDEGPDRNNQDNEHVHGQVDRLTQYYEMKAKNIL